MSGIAADQAENLIRFYIAPDKKLYFATGCRKESTASASGLQTITHPDSL